MEEYIQEKIKELCSFVCNGKTYQYEWKLQKSAEYELYDAAIIYAWNIFMLFVYEKVWQIRELEKLNKDTKFQTDKIFLGLVKNKPDDFFDGSLFSLNKLSENNQGEDAIIGKLKDVYSQVDQQFFREAQQLLQKRNTCAHLNSISMEYEDLNYILRGLIQVIEKIQQAHWQHLNSIFENLEKNETWYLSERDLWYIDICFEEDDIDKSKYVYISKLISTQEVPNDLVENIKNKAISFFLESGGFDTAYQNSQDLIKPLLQYFNAGDIKKILEQSFENTHNQIYPAREIEEIEEIFLELYQLSSNNFPELEGCWKTFAQKITDEGFKSYFKKLLSEIQGANDWGII